MTTAAAPPRRTRAARWIIAPAPDAGVVEALEAELHLPAIVCRLLAIRGHGEPEVAKRFLRPRLDQLHEPALYRDLDRAVERLVIALRTGETILVHGDYDVDGICSTTLLTRALRGMGGATGGHWARFDRAQIDTGAFADAYTSVEELIP